MNNRGQDLVNDMLVLAMIAGVAIAAIFVVAVEVNRVFSYIGAKLTVYTK